MIRVASRDSSLHRGNHQKNGLPVWPPNKGHAPLAAELTLWRRGGQTDDLGVKAMISVAIKGVLP